MLKISVVVLVFAINSANFLITPNCFQFDLANLIQFVTIYVILIKLTLINITSKIYVKIHNSIGTLSYQNEFLC